VYIRVPYVGLIKLGNDWEKLVGESLDRQ